MRYPRSPDSGQPAIGFGSAIATGPLVPGIHYPSLQARDIKQAFRDPSFAHDVDRALVNQMLFEVVALLCFLFLFFFLGYLVTH